MINFVYRNRVKIGLPTFLAGIGSLVGGVIVAHYAGFPKGEIVDYFNWIPRGWLPQTLGQFVAFSGSQLILIGLVLMAWTEKPLTWSKAAYFLFKLGSTHTNFWSLTIRVAQPSARTSRVD